MYAELLQTPHPCRVEAGCEQSPLLASIDVEAIQRRLSEFEASGTIGHQVYSEAVMITQTVSDALCFKSNKGWATDFSPEIVQVDQKTNCYGHTIVLSECLDEAQIPHHVVYTNGHAFVMISDFTSYAWMLDAGDITMNGDMMRALPNQALSKVPKQIAAHGRGSVKFWTVDYFAEVKPQTPIESVSSEAEWLSVAPPTKNYQFKSEREFRADHTLWLSIYQPDSGRNVIEAISRMNHFVATGRFAEAYEKVKEIEGRYPNADERSSRPEIRDITLGLIAHGLINQAVEIPNSVAKSFSPELNPDIRLQTWQADQTREIGARTGRIDILRRAIELYRSVPVSRHEKLLAQKIAKTERMIVAQKQIDAGRSSRV